MVCCGMEKKSMIGYCRALVSERVIRSVYGMVWKGIVEPLMLERIVWCQDGALLVLGVYYVVGMSQHNMVWYVVVWYGRV